MVLPPLLTAKPGAAVPLNVTPLVPMKLLPVSVTTVPASPRPGVKLVITGAGTRRAPSTRVQ